MRGFHCSFAGRVWAISLSADGFQGILVESHYHKENINLSYPNLLRESRIVITAWSITEGFQFQCNSYMQDIVRNSTTCMTHLLSRHYPAPKDAGGRGWIRTIGARRHGSLAGSWIKPSLPHDHMATGVGFEPTGVVSSQKLSRLRRYDHFGTLPLFIRKPFYCFM